MNLLYKYFMDYKTMCYLKMKKKKEGLFGVPLFERFNKQWNLIQTYLWKHINLPMPWINQIMTFKM